MTTRRGLYVAATRGRDDNLLCVVTDSDDVAEARDTLETILAFDRADIPAVTQRRTLAHQQPADAARQRPQPTARCEIPEWFEPLRAELRRDLHDAEQALTASEARAGPTCSRGHRRPTRPRPDRGGDGSGSPGAGGGDGTSTRRRGGATPAPNTTSTTAASAADGPPAATMTPLPRNSKQRPNTSNAPDNTPPQTSSTTTRHEHASTRHSTALHRHDMRQQLNHTVDHVAALRQQVESLDLWGRWAGGDTVNVQQLGDIVEQLTSISRRDEHADQFQTLGQTVRDWAGDAGIDLPTATRHSRTLQRAGPELGPVSAANGNSFRSLAIREHAVAVPGSPRSR